VACKPHRVRGWGAPHDKPWPTPIRACHGPGDPDWDRARRIAVPPAGGSGARRANHQQPDRHTTAHHPHIQYADPDRISHQYNGYSGHANDYANGGSHRHAGSNATCKRDSDLTCDSGANRSS